MHVSSQSHNNEDLTLGLSLRVRLTLETRPFVEILHKKGLEDFFLTQRIP
jgi:hypothetical protein